jgi:hypothetical protein
MVAAMAQTNQRTVIAPSAADYPSIQEAIRANPGRMIYVPAGDYEVSEKVHIGRQGGGLFGPGRICQRNPGQPILVVEGATGAQIRDLTLMRPEGETDTESEGVLAIACRNLILENLQVLDNRTRTAAVELRGCYASQVRNCLVQNYQRVSIDDRTKDEDSGYAFRCLIGTGIVVKECHATLVQGNRVIEQHLFPTPELKKMFHLGDYTKKNRVKGSLVPQKDWDREYTDNWHQATGIHVASPTTTDLTQVLGNYVENSGQGCDIHADHVIIAQNIVKDTMIGMKAMHGSRNVLILGNQFVANDLWSIGLMPGKASHTASSGQGGRPAEEANVDGGSIIANNIISDFGYGHAHWMRAGDDHGIPIRFEAGQKADNPPLRNVIIQGNVVYDSGRDGVLLDGQIKTVPPRYKYAVAVATKGHAPPKGLHFSNNLLSPGTEGVANVELVDRASGQPSMPESQAPR